MICRLCLKESQQTLRMFDGGIQTTIAVVVIKYFWFEPKSDDPISTAVCATCWKTLHDFHKLFLKVEEAHRLLTERFSIKTTNNDSNKCTALQLVEDAELMGTEFSYDTDNNDWLDAGENIDEVSSSTLPKQSFKSDEMSTATVQEESSEKDVELSIPTKDHVSKVKEEKLLQDTKTNKRFLRSTSRALKLSDQQQQQTNETPTNEDPTITPHTIKRRGRPSKRSAVVGSVSSEQNKRSNLDARIAENMQLKCDLCSEDAKTFSELCIHMELTHNCLGYIICCNKKFYKRYNLTDHIEKHINPERFRCNECDKHFADKQCMRNHILLKHQPDEVRYFKCSHCPKKFAKKYLLEQHRVIHEARTHICNICKKGFPAPSMLSTHIKLAHTNYGTMCDICAKVLRSRSAFYRHMLEHSNKPVPKVQCDKCGSWHKDKYSLQKHKRRHNDEGVQHICSYCKKMAPNRSALLSHIRYVHRTARNFNCSVCSKSFKKPINLKEHMAVHTGEVLYKCAHCPKTFNSNANMHSHRKKMHPKEFIESRQKRQENAATPIMPKSAGVVSSTGILADDDSANKSPNDDLPKVLRIQIADNETHNIILSKCIDDDEEEEEHEVGQSFILTVQD